MTMAKRSECDDKLAVSCAFCQPGRVRNITSDVMALGQHALRPAGRNDSVGEAPRKSCRVSNSIIAHRQDAGLYRVVTARESCDIACSLVVRKTGYDGGMFSAFVAFGELMWLVQRADFICLC